ncbi:hypothetical protein Q1695_010538 [Nippostrongylus brasiliensis]|nr:hypothetical protein Q1695_010538 [Nippostrongylus brasiliensis]
MSCRATRARSAKLVLGEPVEQTRKITDVFKVTRGRGRAQKKLLDGGTESRVASKLRPESSIVQQCSTDSEDFSGRAEHVCSPPKRAKKAAESHVSRSAKKALFPSAVVEQQPMDEKQQSTPEVVKAEVPPTVEVKPDIPVPTSLKLENPSEVAHTAEVKSAPEDPLLSKADELREKLNSAAGQNKVRARIRNVAELQAVLAQKGAAKKIHEQVQRNKSKQVEEHANILKSPVKTVPKGSAVVKIKSKGKSEAIKKLVPSSTTVVPEFVLPTYKTPAKQSLEEYELNEQRHVFEYGKASRLVEEVKRNSALPLPRQYERLHESFQSCDRVVSIYTTQGRRCVVSEIRKNVEKNTHISFTRKNLAQMIHVYPTCYEVRLERRRNIFGGDGEPYGKMELVMAANLVDDLNDYMPPDTPVKNDEPLPTVTPSKLMSPRKKVVTALPRDPVIDARPRLEGWRMTCRSHVFKHKLVEIVKRFHKKFLERLGCDLKDDEHAKLRRFHPKFDLDQECEEIREAELPEEDSDKGERLFGMKDYLATVDTSVALPKAVEAAIEELKSPVKKLISSNSAVPLSPRQFAEKQASKPKGAMSLIERIKAKEAAKKAAEKLKDPVVEKKKDLLERILHGLLRCITTYFAFKKVRSMDINMLAEQVMRSQSSMNRVSLMEHIDVLCEVAPAFVAKVELGGRKYLQLKENNYNAIENVLQEELTRLRAGPPSAAAAPQTETMKPEVEKKTAVRSLF